MVKISINNINTFSYILELLNIEQSHFVLYINTISTIV